MVRRERLCSHRFPVILLMQTMQAKMCHSLELKYLNFPANFAGCWIALARKVCGLHEQPRQSYKKRIVALLMVCTQLYKGRSGIKLVGYLKQLLSLVGFSWCPDAAFTPKDTFVAGEIIICRCASFVRRICHATSFAPQRCFMRIHSQPGPR